MESRDCRVQSQESLSGDILAPVAGPAAVRGGECVGGGAEQPQHLLLQPPDLGLVLLLGLVQRLGQSPATVTLLPDHMGTSNYAHSLIGLLQILDEVCGLLLPEL